MREEDCRRSKNMAFFFDARRAPHRCLSLAIAFFLSFSIVPLYPFFLPSELSRHLLVFASVSTYSSSGFERAMANSKREKTRKKNEKRVEGEKKKTVSSSKQRREKHSVEIFSLLLSLFSPIFFLSVVEKKRKKNIGEKKAHRKWRRSTMQAIHKSLLLLKTTPRRPRVSFLCV